MVPAAPIAGLRLERPREFGELRARVAAYAGRNGIESTDAGRHFGLVLNDKEAARRPLPA